MSEQQQPTVGRIVHYVSPLRHDGFDLDGNARIWNPGLQCFAAIIVAVHDGAVTVRAELPPSRSIVESFGWHTVPYSAEPKPGTWHWPERA